MYVLNLGDDGRILAAFVKLPNGEYSGMAVVEKLPEGNYTDYMYVEGEFIYDPLPPVALPEDQPDDVDKRIENLEAAMAAIEEGIASV